MGAATPLSTAAETAIKAAVAAMQSFDEAEADRRWAAVKAVREDAPVSVVADRIGVTRPTLYRWIRDFENAEALVTADDVL